jgi:hypothetical protein
VRKQKFHGPLLWKKNSLLYLLNTSQNVGVAKYYQEDVPLGYSVWAFAHQQNLVLSPIFLKIQECRNLLFSRRMDIWKRWVVTKYLQTIGLDITYYLIQIEAEDQHFGQAVLWKGDCASCLDCILQKLITCWYHCSSYNNLHQCLRTLKDNYFPFFVMF